MLPSNAAFGDYTRDVREAEVGFVVTGPGRDDWSVRRCTVGASVLQFARAAAGTIADGVMLQADRLLFVVQSSRARHRVYLNGERVASHGIAVLAPGSDFIFANQFPHEWISFSVRLDRLSPKTIDRFDEQIELRAPALLATDDALFTELIRVAVCAATARLPTGNPSCGLCRMDAEGELIDALTSAVMSSRTYRFDHKRRDRDQYHVIARDAVARLPDGEKVHVEELCRSVGVKERTLRRAFNNVFKMPPLRYLKLRQLNQVHAALRDTRACGRLVTDILVLHGVTEMGRFATEYRALFGELPSQTIRRHAVSTPAAKL